MTRLHKYPFLEQQTYVIRYRQMLFVLGCSCLSNTSGKKSPHSVCNDCWQECCSEWIANECENNVTKQTRPRTVATTDLTRTRIPKNDGYIVLCSTCSHCTELGSDPYYFCTGQESASASVPVNVLKPSLIHMCERDPMTTAKLVFGCMLMLRVTYFVPFTFKEQLWPLL